VVARLGWAADLRVRTFFFLCVFVSCALFPSFFPPPAPPPRPLVCFLPPFFFFFFFFFIVCFYPDPPLALPPPHHCTGCQVSRPRPKSYVRSVVRGTPSPAGGLPHPPLQYPAMVTHNTPRYASAFFFSRPTRGSPLRRYIETRDPTVVEIAHSHREIYVIIVVINMCVLVGRQFPTSEQYFPLPVSPPRISGIAWMQPSPVLSAHPRPPRSTRRYVIAEDDTGHMSCTRTNGGPPPPNARRISIFGAIKVQSRA